MSVGFPLANRVHRAYLGKNDSIIRFQYNPTQFTDNIAVNYAEINSLGISYPIMQYTGGKTRKITFDIYVNGIAGDGGPDVVHDVINKLNTFVPPAYGKQFQAPSSLIFGFGWFVKECLLESFVPKYTSFTPDLQPLEATISVTLIILQM